MTLNTSWKSIVNDRQALVSGLILRQFSQREICLQLQKLGKVNPQTGRPWGVGTINGDLKRLHQQWREASAARIEQHQAQRLAELAEVKKVAWHDGDLGSILKAIKLECDIIGLAAPIKVDVTLQRLADEFSMTPAEILQEAHLYLQAEIDAPR